MVEATSKDKLLLGLEQVDPTTPIAVTPGDNAIRIMEGHITNNITPAEGKIIKQTFTEIPADMIKEAFKLDISFYIRVGDNLGDLPDWAPVVACSNHNVVSDPGVSVAIAPFTGLLANRKASTFHWYEGGLLYVLENAMATFSYDAPIDGYITGTASIMAPFKLPTVAALPGGIAFQTSNRILVSPSDVVTDVDPVCVGSYTFESSAEVSERRLIGCEEIHMDGRPLPMVNISKKALGTMDDYNRLLNGTLGTFTSVFGAAGNRFTLTAEAGQLRALQVAEDGIHMNDELGISLHETVAGDDPYSILLD